MPTAHKSRGMSIFQWKHKHHIFVNNFSHIISSQYLYKNWWEELHEKWSLLFFRIIICLTLTKVGLQIQTSIQIQINIWWQNKGEWLNNSTQGKIALNKQKFLNCLSTIIQLFPTQTMKRKNICADQQTEMFRFFFATIRWNRSCMID